MASIQKKQWMMIVVVMVVIQMIAGNKPKFFNQCGGSLNFGPPYTYGVLTNPGYPTKTNSESRYPNNADCVWTLDVDDTSLVQIKIWDLNIQLGIKYSNITCDYDYVEITIESIGPKRFCGGVKPDEIIRGMGKTQIKFVSDESVNYRGFQATFQKIIDYNPCVRKDPCVHGDCKFYKENLTSACHCYKGAFGNRCDEDVKECESDPCLNGATCRDDGPINTYTCACAPGWKGPNCGKEIDSPCLSEPCLYGGKCEVFRKSNFTCECQDGYIGYNCAEKTGCGNPGLSFLHPHRRFNFGTMLNFSCIDNYVLIGANISFCQKNGSWTYKAPNCIDLEAEKSKTLDPWTIFMITSSLIFLVNLTVFVVWMKYYKPFSNNEHYEVNKDQRPDFGKENSVYSVTSVSEI